MHAGAHKDPLDEPLAHSTKASTLNWLTLQPYRLSLALSSSCTQAPTRTQHMSLRPPAQRLQRSSWLTRHIKSRRIPSRTGMLRLWSQARALLPGASLSGG